MTMQTDFNLQSIISQLLASSPETRPGAVERVPGEKPVVDFRTVLNDQLGVSGSHATFATMPQSGKSGSQNTANLANALVNNSFIETGKSDLEQADLEVTAEPDGALEPTSSVIAVASSAPDRALSLQLETRQLLNGRPVLTSRYPDSGEVRVSGDDLIGLPALADQGGSPGMTELPEPLIPTDTNAAGQTLGAPDFADDNKKTGMTQPQSLAVRSDSAADQVPGMVTQDSVMAVERGLQKHGLTTVSASSAPLPRKAGTAKGEGLTSTYLASTSLPGGSASSPGVELPGRVLATGASDAMPEYGLSGESRTEGSASGNSNKNPASDLAPRRGEVKGLGVVTDGSARANEFIDDPVTELDAPGVSRIGMESDLVADGKAAESVSVARRLASLATLERGAQSVATASQTSGAESLNGASPADSPGDRTAQPGISATTLDNAPVHERGMPLNQASQQTREFTYRFSNPTTFASEVPEFLAEIIQDRSESADQRIRLRLFPDNLGRIDATITEGSDGLRIQLLAENDQIARLLRESNTVLRDLLADGETAVQVDVDVANAGGGQTSGESGLTDQEPVSGEEQGNSNKDSIIQLNSLSGRGGLDTYV